MTIQFCETYANKAKHMDGDGFDLDQNTTDSVIQYCYSHDNYGAGYLLCHGGTGTWNNNTVRFCVRQNDGYGGKMGGIHYYSASRGLDNARVYGNTVFNSKAPALWITRADRTTGAKVWNKYPTCAVDAARCEPLTDEVVLIVEHTHTNSTVEA